MKSLKSLLLLFALFLVAMPAFAYVTPNTVPEPQEVNNQLMTTIGSMDENQKNVLLERAHDIQSGSDAASKTREWVDIGNSLGQALAGTARELGVAVNDFAKSPVGHLAIALIIWKVLGATVIHLIGGLFCFVILLLWWRLYRRMFGVFNDNGKLIRLTFDDASNEAAGFISMAGVLIAVGGILAIVTA